VSAVVIAVAKLDAIDLLEKMQMTKVSSVRIEIEFELPHGVTVRCPTEGAQELLELFAKTPVSECTGCKVRWPDYRNGIFSHPYCSQEKCPNAAAARRHEYVDCPEGTGCPDCVFQFIVEPDTDGSFHAYCPMLKGLHVSGETEEAALSAAKAAGKAYVLSLLKHGE